jgi:hypothetical protein
VADPVGLQGSQHVCRRLLHETHLARLACCTAPKYDGSVEAGAVAGAGRAGGLCGVEPRMGGKGLLEWWYAAMVPLEGFEDAISSATLGRVGRADEGEVSCSGWPRRCQSLSMVGMGSRWWTAAGYEAERRSGYTGASQFRGRQRARLYIRALHAARTGSKHPSRGGANHPPSFGGARCASRKRCMRARESVHGGWQPLGPKRASREGEDDVVEARLAEVTRVEPAFSSWHSSPRTHVPICGRRGLERPAWPPCLRPHRCAGSRPVKVAVTCPAAARF